MKRLLLEPDCTLLERSLLESIAVDEPPASALEKVRNAVLREEETAVVPAVAARHLPPRRNWPAYLGAMGGVAMGAALLGAMLMRHHDLAAQREPLPPSVPAPVTAPAPPPPTVPEQVPVPQPPTALVPVAPAVAGPDCSIPYVIDAQGHRKYRMECLAKEPTPAAPRSNPVPSAAWGVVGQPSSSPSSAPHSAEAPPFDKGAAAGALGRTSANLGDCMNVPGPEGAGHVTVTFAPNGSVQSAIVDQGPYPGTARGGCVAGKFRAATVPPFAGAPVRVGKSFVLP